MQIPAFLAIVVAIATATLPSSTLADWRDDLGAFRVAIQTGKNVAEALARAEPFRLALEEKLRLPVEFVPSRTHLTMVRSNNRAPAEYAVLSTVAYAAVANMCQCVEPLVTARTNSGASGFRVVILSLPGGPGSISALSGKTLGVISSDAVGGSDIALHELAGEGLVDGANGFALRKFDNGEEATKAFLNREIDALMGWTVSGGSGAAGVLAGTSRQLLSRALEDPGHNIVWRSSEIPFRVHAIRANLPAEAKTALRDLLTGMFVDDPVAYDSIEPIYGGGFYAARPSQFDGLSQMLAEAGVIAQRPTETITTILDKGPVEDAASQEKIPVESDDPEENNIVESGDDS